LADFRNKKVKKNTPKVELHSIMSMVVGSYKTGKTRLWKEVTELHYPGNPEAALLIAFEDGYKTWELENFIPIHEEGSNEDEWKVWEVFRKEIVKGLVEEATTGRITKLIGIDTVDRCIDACTAWILRQMNQKYAKVFTSLQEISDATNGSANGWTLLYNELKKQFDALTNAGYGVMALAWTKEKETTLHDGRKFNSIELMMHNTARKVFESQSSFTCCLYNEVKILDKSGNELDENLKNKKNKEIGTKFHETETMMYFRPSQYIGIAGGRYLDLPEKEVYSAENYLKVFEQAVLSQLKKTTESVEELKEQEQVEREEKSKEFAEQQMKIDEEKNKEDEKLQVKQIIENIKSKAKELQKLGIPMENIKATWTGFTVDKIEKVEEAKAILNKLNEMKK